MPNNRRQFCRTLAGAWSLSSIATAQEQLPWSGERIVDCHHHFRRTPEANIAHLDGCGVSNAMVLARENSVEPIAATRSQYPGRVL